MRETSPSAAPGELAAIMLICFGWAIQASLSASASGFPASEMNTDNALGLVAVELLCAIAACAILYWRGHDLRTMVPSPSWRGALAAIALLLVAWFISALSTLALVMADSDLASAGPPILSTAPLWSALLVSVVNGYYEEVFLLGYLQRNLAAYGTHFALALVLLVRVLYHLYQGPVGAVGVATWGLMLGLFYAWRRTLFAPVVAHVLTDLIALTV